MESSWNFSLLFSTSYPQAPIPTQSHGKIPLLSPKCTHTCLTSHDSSYFQTQNSLMLHSNFHIKKQSPAIPLDSSWIHFSACLEAPGQLILPPEDISWQPHRYEDYHLSSILQQSCVHFYTARKSLAEILTDLPTWVASKCELYSKMRRHGGSLYL